jgi:hypothetical protein
MSLQGVSFVLRSVAPRAPLWHLWWTCLIDSTPSKNNYHNNTCAPWGCHFNGYELQGLWSCGLQTMCSLVRTCWRFGRNCCHYLQEEHDNVGKSIRIWGVTSQTNCPPPHHNTFRWVITWLSWDSSSRSEWRGDPHKRKKSAQMLNTQAWSSYGRWSLTLWVKYGG